MATTRPGQIFDLGIHGRFHVQAQMEHLQEKYRGTGEDHARGEPKAYLERPRFQAGEHATVLLSCQGAAATSCYHLADLFAASVRWAMLSDGQRSRSAQGFGQPFCHDWH